MLALLLAGFTGQFQGSGTAITPRRSRACREIFLELEERTDRLLLKQGGYICEDMQAGFDPATFLIRQGRLFYQGADVGSISGERLELSYEDSAEGYTYELTLTRQGPQLGYEERWIENGAKALVVKGNLTRRETP